MNMIHISHMIEMNFISGRINVVWYHASVKGMYVTNYSVISCKAKRHVTIWSYRSWRPFLQVSENLICRAAVDSELTTSCCGGSFMCECHNSFKYSVHHLWWAFVFIKARCPSLYCLFKDNIPLQLRVWFAVQVNLKEFSTRWSFQTIVLMAAPAGWGLLCRTQRRNTAVYYKHTTRRRLL